MDYTTQRNIVICYIPSEQESNQVKPIEFLAWAKSDIKAGDRRGRGNALGNIKKAMHSRIDEIITSTHLHFAKDWSWKKLYTEDKLSILRQIGVEKTSIAKITTDIRNKYEHSYIVPSADDIRAYCDIVDLWLEDSYKKYNFGRIGIFDLPIYDIIKEGEVVKKIVLTDDYKDITYFWDYKHSLFKTSKKKPSKITTLKDLGWKEILALEKGFIKNLRNREIHYLSQPNLTKVFKIYDEKVKRKFVGFLKVGTHVTL